MIELLKGFPITSSQSTAGTCLQGSSQGGADGSPRACRTHDRDAGTTGPGTSISGDVIFESRRPASA